MSRTAHSKQSNWNPPKEMGSNGKMFDVCPLQEQAHHKYSSVLRLLPGFYTRGKGLQKGCLTELPDVMRRSENF